MCAPVTSTSRRGGSVSHDNRAESGGHLGSGSFRRKASNTEILEEEPSPFFTSMKLSDGKTLPFDCSESHLMAALVLSNVTQYLENHPYRGIFEF